MKILKPVGSNAAACHRPSTSAVAVAVAVAASTRSEHRALARSSVLLHPLPLYNLKKLTSDGVHSSPLVAGVKIDERSSESEEVLQ